MIKALTKLIAGDDYDLGPWVEAKTPMVPAKKTSEGLREVAGILSPFIPTWMLELRPEEDKNYIVPRSQLDLIVKDEDVDDWNYLLDRFNKLLNNFIKVLDNIRRVNYYDILADKLLEREIETRKLKITEKLLEKVRDRKEEGKTKEEKIRDLATAVTALVGAGALGAAAASGAQKNKTVNPLDAATLESAQASGADLRAAAHLATLEASGAQDVADVLQVMLNRSAKNHSGYGPLMNQIIAPEQFSPYSAAIYGDSADGNAASYYGSLNVTPQEIVALASKPNGIDLLVERFGAGNASIAKQVLKDFEEDGPLSQSSAEFVGGMVSFRGMNVQLDVEYNQRHGEANKFFARGGIVLPDLFGSIPLPYKDITKDISKFVIDRPTIINANQIGEPLVVIPTERPIGKEILNILFKEPFRKIENIFERRDKDAIPKTPIQNNTTSINRTTIPKSETPESSYEPQLKRESVSEEESLNVTDAYTIGLELGEQFSNMFQNSKGAIIPSTSRTTGKVSNIDTVSQKTENVFGPTVILMTQDIYATEE
tara:strand:+ start:8667 stop:10292 length:1626 start_codon:yes stop_codon:yes gene_type:complete